MNIFDFLKRQSKDNKDTALVVKNNQSLLSFIHKRSKINTLVKFIKQAVIENGGDYEDVCSKLQALSQFTQDAKSYGINCNLESINEALNDFFIEQNIKFTPIKDNPHAAFYTKKDKGYNRYNYRGVTVLQDQQECKPILYFGRRNENAETHRNDNLLAFGEDMAILKYDSQYNYDEIPLYGAGTFAVFYFDKLNQITSVKFKYKTNSRLGFWSDTQVCDIDPNTNQFKLTTLKLPAAPNNDPKPTAKSRDKIAQMLIDGYKNNSIEK